MHKFTMLFCLAAALAASGEPSCGLVKKPVIMMSEGVTGGIAPRPVPLQVIVLPAADGTSRVYVMRRDTQGQVTCTQGTGEAFAQLQKQLDLQGLPQEKNQGMADPYELSVSLHDHTGKDCWANSPPNGCVRGPQTVHPSAAEKQRFAAAVKQLEKVADGARQPMTEKAYEDLRSSLYPSQ